MAIVTYPLNGIDYDASNAETYLCTRTSGVFSADGNFQARVTGERRVSISEGLAWIQNKQFAGKSVCNTELVAVEIPLADGTRPRIDRVVLRFDKAANASSIVLKQGTPSSTPAAPAVERTELVYELGLCTVYVPASSTIVSAGDVTSTLLDETVCGLMRDGVTGIPTAQLQEQVEALLSDLRKAFESQLSDQESDFSVWFGNREEEFDGWFETIKGKLGEDPAGSLQNQVDALNAAVTGYPLALTANTNSLQITAKRNSIENAKIEGFTSDGQSGGMQLVEYTFTGQETWYSNPTSSSGKYRLLMMAGFPANIAIPSGDSVPGVLYSTKYPAVGASATYQARVGISVSSEGYIYIFDENFSTNDPSAWKQHLQNLYNVGTPLKMWYLPSDISRATGLYIPIQAQGHEYRCQMMELTEALGVGDNVQSNVQSGCDKRIVLDGKTATVVVRTSEKYGYVNVTDPDGYSRDKAPFSNFLPYKSDLSGNEYIGFNAHTISGGYGFNLRLPVEASSEAYNAYLQQNPLVVYLLSTSHTEKNDIPVQLETHANGNVYARDPVHIPNEDGATTLSTQEGCTLELFLSKNEAKAYAATLLMDSWKSESGAYTQTAEVKCLEGLGFISADSSFDSPLWVNQTEDLATNETLTEALGIVNTGYTILGDGTITCKVAEKPTTDLEIRFKAKR